MKNFNIWWVHSGLRGVTKHQYIGGLPKKGELGEFADLSGGRA